jgi:threonine synthase
MLGAPHRKVGFVVPTGNFGDAFAGFVAHKMGLPIERIVAATNSNDIVARALQTGQYSRGAVQATQSPAMDIQIASNFERLYFEAVGRDAAATARAFKGFGQTGSIDIPAEALVFMRQLFEGDAVDEAETSAAIRDTLRDTGELIDPHTAVAVRAALRLRAGAGDASTPLIVLSTAHPAKFPEAVFEAAGAEPRLPTAAIGLDKKTETFDRLPADAEAVKNYLRAFAICNQNDAP